MSFQKMRQEYFPQQIRLLMVAEAPPESPDRFFYKPDVARHDSLFLETSKVLLPGLWVGHDAKAVRGFKHAALGQLRDLGFFLVDALDERLPQGMTDAECARRIRANMPTNVAEIAGLLRDRGAIDAVTILVKGTVFSNLAEPLRAQGVYVPQAAPIPFPASGGQRRFREAFRGNVSVDLVGGKLPCPGPGGLDL